MNSNTADRRATAATLRETAVLVGSLAVARRRVHLSCTDPDCTPRAVFVEFDQLLHLAAELEALALSWELTGEKPHPSGGDLEKLERLVRQAACRYKEALRRVAMGEADA